MYIGTLVPVQCRYTCCLNIKSATSLSPTCPLFQTPPLFSLHLTFPFPLHLSSNPSPFLFHCSNPSPSHLPFHCVTKSSTISTTGKQNHREYEYNREIKTQLTHSYFMVNHWEYALLWEYSSSVVLKLRGSINATRDGTSGKYLCLHLVCPRHSAIVTNIVTVVLGNLWALERKNQSTGNIVVRF